MCLWTKRHSCTAADPTASRAARRHSSRLGKTCNQIAKKRQSFGSWWHTCRCPEMWRWSPSCCADVNIITLYKNRGSRQGYNGHGCNSYLLPGNFWPACFFRSCKSSQTRPCRRVNIFSMHRAQPLMLCSHWDNFKCIENSLLYTWRPQAWPKLSTLLVGLVYSLSSGALAILTHCLAMSWSSTMACMQPFGSMARDVAVFWSSLASSRGASFSHPLCNFLHCTTHACICDTAWNITALSQLWEIV